MTLNTLRCLTRAANPAAYSFFLLLPSIGTEAHRNQ